MRLNPDCVRDILLSAEEMADGKKLIAWDCSVQFRKYSADVFRYHVLQCQRYDYFVDGGFVGSTDIFHFSDISPKAHDFLANIRDNSMWNKVKKKMVELGVSSLEQIPVIAAAVVKAQLFGI